MFCREWLAQLEQHQEQFSQAGLRIIAVGLGEPKHARNIGGRIAPHLTCLVDSHKTAYALYGLQQGTWQQLLGPAVIAAGARAASGGHFQGEATGDTKMLPGTFVIDTQGIVRYAFYSEHAGDHPEIDKLLAVS